VREAIWTSSKSFTKDEAGTGVREVMVENLTVGVIRQIDTRRDIGYGSGCEYVDVALWDLAAKAARLPRIKNTYI
jgi:L-alanine-DL-glutamate epimerase-like enolase superfamily enzyme